MTRVVLQKLLSVDMSRNVVQRGFDQVGGIVVEAGDAVGLNTPESLLSAYGFDQDLDTAYVDVTRFETPTCAQAIIPVDTGERPWPTCARNEMIDVVVAHTGHIPQVMGQR